MVTRHLARINRSALLLEERGNAEHAAILRDGRPSKSAVAGFDG
jgi:hypothetical protein